MPYFIYNQDEHVNIYKYVERFTPKKDSLRFTGIEYNDTRRYSCYTLKVFIERDIYLACKAIELPYLNSEVIVEKIGELYVMHVAIKHCAQPILNRKFFQRLKYQAELLRDPFGFVQDHQLDALSGLGFYVKSKLHQILWKYNQVEYSASDKGNKRRYLHKITLAPCLIKNELSKIRAKTNTKRQQTPRKDEVNESV